MSMKCYVNLLVKHPYLIVLIVAAFSSVCCILPFTLESMRFPTFQDPQLGFSTRNTPIASGHVAWQNLQNELRPSGTLTKNPKEYLSVRDKQNVTNEPFIRRKGERRKPYKPFKNSIKKNQNDIDGYEDTKNSTIYYGKVVTSGRHNATKQAIMNKWHILQNFTHHASSKRVFYEQAFCGGPDEKYAQIVITSASQQNLFTFEHLQSLCKLENIIMNLNSVAELCISNTHIEGQCCRPWSIPNYIAKLYNRTSCLGITEGDINDTLSMLSECSPYFHHNDMHDNCFSEKTCQTPLKCLKYEAAFTIFNYLASTSFFPKDKPYQKLEETIMFLPVASGIGSVPLFKEVYGLNADFEGLRIVAIDFGIKTIIFDEYLLRDAWFMGLGAALIFACVWMYTASIFLTFMTLLSLVFGLAITYFLYTMVYQIAFFPFMNVVSIIICLGVGADNAFIFCKMWYVKKAELASEEATILRILSETFAHAFKSMLVTSLTTAVAFWGSYVSSITAISCFSVFAGTAIVVNFLLTMSWFPACLVIWDQAVWIRIRPSCNLFSPREACSNLLLRLLGTSLWLQIVGQIWSYKIEFIITLVTKLRYFWILIFTSIAMAAVMVVFIYPGLVLPSDADLQLLQYNHPFEQYDFVYKNKFWFQREPEGVDAEQYKLPLRFVWGIQPVDNGNHLNPNDLGQLVYDSSFNMTDSESQIWLRNFCSKLKSASFYHQSIIISLTNCFIDTFATSMQRPCTEAFSNNDLSPCCKISPFPFDQIVFDKCIFDEMHEIYSGPAKFLYPKSAGAYFSKQDLPTIKAVVVEFESNVSFSLSFDGVDDFYGQVKEFLRLQMLTAPLNMKNGFFTSDITFYDLQRELKQGTESAIFVSMILASCVLFLSTLNPLLSALAVLTITFSIITTMASLILLGWKLNILESIVISTAIGLSVDFSLHYCINYRMCPEHLAGNRKDATRYALSCLMGPSFMAGFTTAISGFIMIFSWVLPYYQIGLFLVLIMTISWLYATFFLGSLLVTFGPINDCCQLSYARVCGAFIRQTNQSIELREVDSLAGTSTTALEKDSFIKPQRKKEPSVLYSAKLNEHSPSSNITIILTEAEDN